MRASLARALVGWGILLLLTVLLYHPAWPLPFEGWDDMGWIRDVQRRDTLARMFHPWLMTGNEGPDTSYVPIQSVVYWLVVKTFGAVPTPFRVLGALAHALSGVLVFAVAVRLGVRRVWAAFAALYFVVAASQAAVLTWVSAIVPHALVLPQLLAALLLCLRSSWGAAIGLVTVAALMKESALTLVALLPLASALVDRTRPRVWQVAPLGLLLAGAVAVQLSKYEHGYVANRFGGVSLGVRLPLRVLDFLTLHVWPTNGSLVVRHVLMAMALTGLGWAVWRWRHTPRLAFVAAWLVLWLLPFSFSNFRPILGLNRYLYLSSVPFALLLAMGLQALAKWRQWPAQLAGVSVLIMHAAATWQRARGH